MKEKTLLKLALLCSAIGIVILFFIVGNVSVDEKTIDKINKDNLGEYVKIKGSVTKAINTDKVMILEITQPATMTVVLFKDKDQIDINQGDYIEVLGQSEEYNGKLEVIGKKVRVVG